jgi:predicted enzyme related to lactoylglutathione lyase
MDQVGGVDSSITFLYYHEIQPVALFYEDVLGFELVEDQGWAKIYRMGGNAFLGVVAGEKGFHQPQDRNAVLVTLCTGDVSGWFEHLKGRGVKLLTEVQEREEIQIRCFFFQDPGGYTFEVQQFLKTDLVKTFHSR